MPRRTWTDDDLRAALDGATTMRQVVERLRLTKGGAAYTTVRSRMEQLGLEPPGGDPVPAGALTAPWRRSYSEDDLRAAVAEARSLKGVFDHLGLQVGGGQWLAVRQLIAERGWSTAHWRRPLGTAGTDPGEVARFRAALTAADLPALVARASNRADIIRALGFTPRSALYRVLRPVLAASGLDLDHFEPAHTRMQLAPPRPRRPLEEVLVAGSHVSTHGLKLRLLEECIFEHRCSRCELTTWLGGPIPLQLDHISGDRSDNRIENLRLLCPNCHALTDTYCGRNIGRR
ncbi:HNH endonuclease [Nitriliruptor alkaliphilus]|uniref:HNH endonuclease n=1 Tax=Nitriliruptor alkaliphilus TaxID=427918 RepID=UPI0006962DE2|nr:HNH endonuclease [Nitriliruptor alkaliphilus]